MEAKVFKADFQNKKKTINLSPSSFLKKILEILRYIFS